MPKPNYSHTYQTCIHSMKRENAPWRVHSSCDNRARLFTGRHYVLPNRTVCVTCPFYCKSERISIGRTENEQPKI